MLYTARSFQEGTVCSFLCLWLHALSSPPGGPFAPKLHGHKLGPYFSRWKGWTRSINLGQSAPGPSRQLPSFVAAIWSKYFDVCQHAVLESPACTSNRLATVPLKEAYRKQCGLGGMAVDGRAWRWMGMTADGSNISQKLHGSKCLHDPPPLLTSAPPPTSFNPLRLGYGNPISQSAAFQVEKKPGVALPTLKVKIRSRNFHVALMGVCASVQWGKNQWGKNIAAEALVRQARALPVHFWQGLPQERNLQILVELAQVAQCHREKAHAERYPLQVPPTTLGLLDRSVGTVIRSHYPRATLVIRVS